MQVAQQYKASGSKAIEIPDLSLDSWSKVELLDVLGQQFTLPDNDQSSKDDRNRNADPLLTHWINGVLDTKAQMTGKAPLTPSSRTKMTNLLLGLRDTAEQSIAAKRTGKSLTNQQKIAMAGLMAKGELMFSQILGMPLSEFMSSLSKDDLKMMFNPSPYAG